jgi:hypothetical protein
MERKWLHGRHLPQRPTGGGFVLFTGTAPGFMQVDLNMSWADSRSGGQGA